MQKLQVQKWLQFLCYFSFLPQHPKPRFHASKWSCTCSLARAGTGSRLVPWRPRRRPRRIRGPLANASSLRPRFLRSNLTWPRLFRRTAASNCLLPFLSTRIVPSTVLFMTDISIGYFCFLIVQNSFLYEKKSLDTLETEKYPMYIYIFS